MIVDTVNTVAALVIVAWATWCMLSPLVNDGICGKVLYVLIALSALGMLHDDDGYSQASLNVMFALVGARHYFMKHFWQRIKAGVLRRIRCATCPHK